MDKIETADHKEYYSIPPNLVQNDNENADRHDDPTFFISINANLHTNIQ